jgi:hypothetical protein
MSLSLMSFVSLVSLSLLSKLKCLSLRLIPSAGAHLQK